MVVDFHDLNYTGENFLFCFSGNLEHEKAEILVEKYFSNLIAKKPISDKELILKD